MDPTSCGNCIDMFQIDETRSSSIQHRAPYVGMKFKTTEEARAYYDDFGRQNDFWIRAQIVVKSRPRINEVALITFDVNPHRIVVPKPAKI